MIIDVAWVGIVVVVVSAIIGGFYTLFRSLNENVVHIHVLKKDVETLNTLMNDLDDHIVTIWQSIDRLDSRRIKNKECIQKLIADLDARIDTIEIAHARHCNENLRER